MERQDKNPHTTNILVFQIQLIAFNHIMARINRYVQSQDIQSSNALLSEIKLCLQDVQFSNHQKSEIVLALLHPMSIQNDKGQLSIIQNLQTGTEYRLENSEKILRLCVENQQTTMMKWALEQITHPNISLLNELLVQATILDNASLFKSLIEHGAQWDIEHQTPVTPTTLTCIELAIFLDKPNIARLHFNLRYQFPTLDKVVNLMYGQNDTVDLKALNPQSVLLTTLKRLIICQTQFLNTLENFRQHERYIHQNPNERANPLRASYREQLILRLKETGCYFHSEEKIEDIIQGRSKIAPIQEGNQTEFAELFLKASQQSPYSSKP